MADERQSDYAKAHSDDIHEEHDPFEAPRLVLSVLYDDMIDILNENKGNVGEGMNLVRRVLVFLKGHLELIAKDFCVSPTLLHDYYLQTMRDALRNDGAKSASMMQEAMFKPLEKFLVDNKLELDLTKKNGLYVLHKERSAE